MKIRMTVEMSGTRNGQPWPGRGTVAELPTAEAAHLCASGVAEPVAEPETVETATAPPAEAAEVPKVETSAESEPETRRGRGRPRKLRDDDGNIVKE